LLTGFKGIKSHQGNILVEMCSDEFLLKHALAHSSSLRLVGHRPNVS